MKHIKLYENWLNEGEGIKIDSILSQSLANTKKIIDSNLTELSKYGKPFESQIRKNIDTLRNKYASNDIWNNLSSKEGIKIAIENFKELFFLSYRGKGYSNSPLNGLTIKINKALELNDGDFFEVTLDNNKSWGSNKKYQKLWRSNEAVELKDIIVDGNEDLAKGIAASFILLDLGIAITNGFYYISSKVAIKKENINLNTLLNNTMATKYQSYEKISRIGKESNYFNGIADIYSVSYGGNAPKEWKGFNVESDYSEFSSYVKKMNVDFIINSINDETNLKEPPTELFAPLFIGYYMTNNANYSIAKATEFMKAGGPSFLQSIISKIS